MEFLDRNEIERMMIVKHIDGTTKKGKSYIEALEELANIICYSKEHTIYKSSVCFYDYYITLAYKRNLGTISRDLGTMSKQDIFDYERLRRLKNIDEIISFWQACPDCLVSAIDACYQMSKRPNTYREQMEQQLNDYDQCFLEMLPSFEKTPIKNK